MTLLPKTKKNRPMIILGADHGGFKLKQAIKKALFNKEYFIEDFSPKLIKGDDYPDEAKSVAEEVSKKRNTVGFLFCKTGTGMVMAANKMKGIRAAFAHDEHVVKMARKDEDANVLCFPATIKPAVAIKFVNSFLKTEFTGATRHKRRINKLKKMEK